MRRIFNGKSLRLLWPSLNGKKKYWKYDTALLSQRNENHVFNNPSYSVALFARPSFVDVYLFRQLINWDFTSSRLCVSSFIMIHLQVSSSNVCDVISTSERSWADQSWKVFSRFSKHLKARATMIKLDLKYEHFELKSLMNFFRFPCSRITAHFYPRR